MAIGNDNEGIRVERGRSDASISVSNIILEAINNQ